MKSSQCVLGSCLLAVAVIASSGGTTWADDTYSEDATAYYNVESELLLHMATVNGTVYHTLHTGGTKYVEYRRPTSGPAWTVTSENDETYSYYRAVPAQVPQPLGLLCCEFVCASGAGGLNTQTDQCTAAGNNCDICTQVCSSYNPTCPTRIGRFIAPLTE